MLLFLLLQPSTAIILTFLILAQILHALLFICLLAFTVDILYQCFVVPHYFGASFFFWADIVGTLSITIDLPWLNPLASLSSEDLGTDTTVLRATRTSKLGARFGRFGKVRIRVSVCLWFGLKVGGGGTPPARVERFGAVRKLKRFTYASLIRS